MPLAPRRSSAGALFASALLLAAAALILYPMMQWVIEPLEKCSAHPVLQFAGTANAALDELGREPCSDLRMSALRTSLYRDFALAAAYGPILWLIIRYTRDGWKTGRPGQLAKAATALPLAALALDWLENVLLLAALPGGEAAITLESGWWAPGVPAVDTALIWIATVAWLKWLALAGSVFVAAASVWAHFAPKARPVEDPAPPEPTPAGGLGICCSGGGIRAAAFTLGAFRPLEDRGVMAKTRWLSAVSGGAYAATGWTLLREGMTEGNAAEALYNHLRGAADGTFDDEELIRRQSKLGRHRYLAKGPGGLPRTVLYAMLAVAANVALVTAATVAGAWPLGRLLGSWAVMRIPDGSTVLPETLALEARLWFPGAMLVGLAALFVSLSVLWPSILRIAGLTAGVGVVLLVLLVVFPWSMIQIEGLLAGRQIPGVSAWTIAGVSLAGAAASAWKLLRTTVVARVTTAAPRLGGVLLGLVVIVFGGKVATDAASGSGWWSDESRWMVCCLALGLAFVFIDIQWISLRETYRSRLQRSFALGVEDGSVVERQTWQQPTWTSLVGEQPELLICCAAQRIGLASRSGLASETFTISPTAVRSDRAEVSTDRYLASLRWFSPVLARMTKPSSWLATTGAAFSSAMGRHSLGTTNALMAAVNADLGIWLPNPRKVAEGYTGFGPVRLGYLVKEILGWYDECDDYVFVADGGQWENLGLVELLRRRCSPILCIDGSGDRPGSFATFREAITLASTELDDALAIDLGVLDEPETLNRLVVSIRFVLSGRDGNTHGVIHFAKLQLAAALPPLVRRFANMDPQFPHYSTTNQLLDDQQFEFLVAAGQAAGLELTQLLDE